MEADLRRNPTRRVGVQRWGRGRGEHELSGAGVETETFSLNNVHAQYAVRGQTGRDDHGMADISTDEGKPNHKDPVDGKGVPGRGGEGDPMVRDGGPNTEGGLG